MLTSILRTVVPALWGSLIAWLVATVPALEPLREFLLSYAEWIVTFLAALITGAWYTLWRWLEPRLPDWLTRVLLGSSKAPVYYPPTTDEDNDQTVPEQRQPIPGTTLEGLGE